MNVEITALHVYPVKSMRGIAVDQATLTPRGLLRDRYWMVIGPEGRFVSQRELPRLALVRTKLDDSGVTLSLDGHGSCSLAFDSSGGDPRQVSIWGDVCEALDAGDETARWLADTLENGEGLRLVRMAPGFERPQRRPRDLGAETHTQFADTAPFLVANEASLDALNAELTVRGLAAVPMNRFRPNIVVRGLPAFGEHELDRAEAGGYSLRFRHPCQRCVVTTIDQETAARNPDWQPYRTLRDLNPMPGNERAPAFAHNATLQAGAGRAIAVGDRLKVVHTD